MNGWGASWPLVFAFSVGGEGPRFGARSLQNLQLDTAQSRSKINHKSFSMKWSSRRALSDTIYRMNCRPVYPELDEEEEIVTPSLI